MTVGIEKCYGNKQYNTSITEEWSAISIARCRAEDKSKNFKIELRRHTQRDQ